MKILDIKRNKSIINFKTSKGDVYTDVAELIENGLLLYRTEYANSDSTNDYHGGRLATGCWYGIVSHRKMTISGKEQDIRVIKYFQINGLKKALKEAEELKKAKMTDDEKKKYEIEEKKFEGDEKYLKNIKSDADLTLEMMTLPSSIPNPNHGGEDIVEAAQMHPGGWAWDWSHACCSILNDTRNKNLMEYDRLMSYLPHDNEIIIIKITE